MFRERATTALPYIKLKTYKTVVTVDTLEKWKTRPKLRQSSRQFKFHDAKTVASAVTASVKRDEG
jgi:hypothetical protein